MMQAKQKLYLRSEDIMRFLIGQEEKLDNLILCGNYDGTLITTDQNLYEALGSIKDKSTISYNKLVKLLEVTQVMPLAQLTGKERQILTQERADEINAKFDSYALKKSNEESGSQSQ